MNILVIASLIAGLVALFGCASTSSRTSLSLDRQVVTALSPKQVIEIARACYQANGAKPFPNDDDYVLAYQVLPTKRLWTVHLGGFNPPSSDWVVIDDLTRKAEFFPSWAPGRK